MQEQSQELIHELKLCMQAALKKYNEVLGGGGVVILLQCLRFLGAFRWTNPYQRGSSCSEMAWVRGGRSMCPSLKFLSSTAAFPSLVSCVPIVVVYFFILERRGFMRQMRQSSLLTPVCVCVCVFCHCVAGDNYSPKLAVVVVQKRISTRIFGRSGNGYENPPPGVIVDHTVTKRWDQHLSGVSVFDLWFWTNQLWLLLGESTCQAGYSESDILQGYLWQIRFETWSSSEVRVVLSTDGCWVMWGVFTGWPTSSHTCTTTGQVPSELQLHAM